MTSIAPRARVCNPSGDRLSDALVVASATSVLDGHGLAAVPVVGKWLLLGDGYNVIIIL